MPKKSLKDRLKAEIETVIEQRDEAQAKFDHWSFQLTDATNELTRLQRALRALDGEAETIFPDLLAPQISVLRAETTQRQFPQNRKETEVSLLAKPTFGKSATGAKIEVIDGIEYEVPQGFVLGKNSFGEVSLLPEGAAPMPAMEEPLKPGPVASSLPPLSGSEGFDRPEDLL